MSLPLRVIPAEPRWDCHGCGDCCSQYAVSVTDDERRRIESQGWRSDPRYQGVELFRRPGPIWKRGGWVLNHDAGGSCVFLGEDRRCRIHGKFGSEAKPLACRVYPFMLVPTGSGWRVGLRYSCPSASGDKGRPLPMHRDEIESYAAELERRQPLAGLAAPPMRRGQHLGWDEVEGLAEHLAGIFAGSEPVEWQVRKCLTLVEIFKKANFDEVTGERFAELVEVLGEGIGDEVLPRDKVEPPGWVGRTVFRQLLALAIRKDSGKLQGIAKQGRLALLRAAWAFGRGVGPVPKLNALIPDATFEKAEVPGDFDAPQHQDLMRRYFRTKLVSLQFAGSTNFRRNVVDGLETLFLVLPMVGWLYRVFRQGPMESPAAMALSIVDDNFGFNPLLGSRRMLRGQRMLSAKGELARLAAWYAV